MKAIVNIIVGSSDDLNITEQTEAILNEYNIPYKTDVIAFDKQDELKVHLKNNFEQGVKVIVAGNRGNFDFVCKLSKLTSIPVIGIPMRSLDKDNNLSSVFTDLQQPNENAIATVALDSGHNAGLLAVQIVATTDDTQLEKMIEFKENLKQKILKADKELSEIKFDYRTN